MKKDAVANSNKVSVTFELPAVAAGTVSVVGDFNELGCGNGLMKQRKDGVWTKAVRLAPGAYRFRYLADGTTWHNDPAGGWLRAVGLSAQDNCIVIVD